MVGCCPDFLVHSPPPAQATGTATQVICKDVPQALCMPKEENKAGKYKVR